MSYSIMVTYLEFDVYSCVCHYILLLTSSLYHELLASVTENSWAVSFTSSLSYRLKYGTKKSPDYRILHKILFIVGRIAGDFLLCIPSLLV